VGIVLLPYVAKPSTMTADTSIPFTFGSTTRDDLEPYHPALAHYAAAELEKLRLNSEATAHQSRLFLGYVERFIRSMIPVGPKTVRVARNYFGEVRGGGRRENERPVLYPWRIL